MQAIIDHLLGRCYYHHSTSLSTLADCITRAFQGRERMSLQNRKLLHRYNSHSLLYSLCILNQRTEDLPRQGANHLFSMISVWEVSQALLGASIYDSFEGRYQQGLGERLRGCHLLPNSAFSLHSTDPTSIFSDWDGVGGLPTMLHHFHKLLCRLPQAFSPET
uniref:Uncharacterized protein n=1 Tax=Opuntia streptacantha TaxID=393608 RepID=A0A7C9AQJ5_OPUST